MAEIREVGGFHGGDPVGIVVAETPVTGRRFVPIRVHDERMS